MQVACRFPGIVAVSLFLLTLVSTDTAKYSGGTRFGFGLWVIRVRFELRLP